MNTNLSWNEIYLYLNELCNDNNTKKQVKVMCLLFKHGYVLKGSQLYTIRVSHRDVYPYDNYLDFNSGILSLKHQSNGRPFDVILDKNLLLELKVLSGVNWLFEKADGRGYSKAIKPQLFDKQFRYTIKQMRKCFYYHILDLDCETRRRWLSILGDLIGRDNNN